MNELTDSQMNITVLGEARYPSPIRFAVDELARIPENIVRVSDPTPPAEMLFEVAGPRAKIFFDAAQTRAGIVTCGGLCPGLNNVIRSVFLELYHHYGVQDVLGFRYGYQGLDPAFGWEPIVLTPDFVEDIHQEGGTVLGTSRGPVDVGRAVDNLIRRKVNILFAVGGDGTQRGARALFLEAQRRDYVLAVVGIPKTVDNDVPFVSRTFGYLTAIEVAASMLRCAHTEAHSVPNGISLVKIMGRHAGFVTAGATAASQEVNFCLIPEVPFALAGDRGFLAMLKARILNRGHALIAVAEGAGQELLGQAPESRDASGNIRLMDIGSFLRSQIDAYFKAEKIPIVLRYIDPGYTIRSVPASAEDAIMCDLFARQAVHAAMAGKTGILIGYLHDRFIHVPIEQLTTRVKRIDPNAPGWHAVLASTGQPARFE